MKIFEQIEEMCKTGEMEELDALKAIVFLEDLVKEGSLAGIGKSVLSTSKWLLPPLLIGAGSAATNIAINKSVAGGYEKKLNNAVEPGYQKMLEVSPALRNENQDDVRNNYNTLMKFAPSIAMDPYAAAGYIKRVLQFDPESGADYNVLKTLVSLEKDHQAARAGGVVGITDPISGASKAVTDRLMDTPN